MRWEASKYYSTGLCAWAAGLDGWPHACDRLSNSSSSHGACGQSGRGAGRAGAWASLEGEAPLVQEALEAGGLGGRANDAVSCTFTRPCQVLERRHGQGTTGEAWGPHAASLQDT